MTTGIRFVPIGIPSFEFCNIKDKSIIAGARFESILGFFSQRYEDRFQELQATSQTKKSARNLYFLKFAFRHLKINIFDGFLILGTESPTLA